MNHSDTDSDNTKFDDELMAAAAALGTDVAPSRDLWPAIEQAITMPAKANHTVWNSVWAQAAAVLLLVGGSSAVTYVVVSENAASPTQFASGGVSDLRFERVTANFGSFYSLGPDYQDARRSLSAKVDDQLGRLSAEERELVLRNIAVIRTAIDDINLALADEPDNSLLQKLLINTYQEELELMMRVDDIASAAMRRGDI